MRRFSDMLQLGVLGAFVCAFLFWIYFIVLAIIDGGNAGEAAFYGIVFAFGAFAIGAVVGALTALLRANLLGGAALGAASVAVFVLLWALSGAGDGGFARSLTRAYPFAIYYSVPGILAGLVVAWQRQRRARRRLSLTPGQPV